jgi:hypothetical protein
MKRIIGMLLAALCLMQGTAFAKGCVKGAVVGGVVGHVAGHHAVAGAVAGCVVGHEMAKKQAQEQKAAAARGQAAQNGQGGTAPNPQAQKPSVPTAPAR